ncbi:MAG: hypothetical protein AAGI23_06955 [Bacteroidota bacterium]
MNTSPLFKYTQANFSVTVSAKIIEWLNTEVLRRARLLTIEYAHKKGLQDFRGKKIPKGILYGYERSKAKSPRFIRSLPFALQLHYLLDVIQTDQTDQNLIQVRNEELFKIFSEKFFFRVEYNSRTLYNWTKAIEKDSWVNVDLRYFSLFCDFIEYSDVDRLESAIEAKYGEKILRDQRTKWKIVYVNEFIENEKQKQKKKEVHNYLMHFIYETHSDNHLGFYISKLHSGSAVFTDTDSRKGTVKITNLEDDNTYSGYFEHINKHYFVANLKNDKTDSNRPLTIHFSNSTDTSFKDKEIVIGQFTYINKKLFPSQGAFIFEHISENGQSKMDKHKLIYFLSLPKAQVVPHIPLVETIDQFNSLLINNFSWNLVEDITNRVGGRYYEAFILVNKNVYGSERQNKPRYVERILFYFSKDAQQVVCQSLLTSDGIVKAELKGNVFIHSKRLDIYAKEGEADYRFLLDFKENTLEGSYTGVSLSNTITSGRIILYEISELRYRTISPRLYNIEQKEHISLFKEERYNRLRLFFEGNLDNYLDDYGPFQAKISFDERIQEGTERIDDFVGSYFFYRTRTAIAHNDEVKRIPLYIKKDGMGFRYRKNNPHFENNGDVYIRDAKMYLAFDYANGNKGLAIFRLDADSKQRYMSGLYIGVEKFGNPICGRAYIYRVSEDISGFEKNIPEYISTQDTSTFFKDEIERNIIISLSGKISNYHAVYNSNATPVKDYSQLLFDAARWYATQDNPDMAAHSLELALWEGGFRDKEAFVKAVSSGELKQVCDRLEHLTRKPFHEFDSPFKVKQRELYLDWLESVKSESEKN